MAYPDMCSQQSVLQMRSQKLIQQRCLIGEKNDSKRKFSGKILPLSRHQPFIPNPSPSSTYHVDSLALTDCQNSSNEQGSYPLTCPSVSTLKPIQRNSFIPTKSDSHIDPKEFISDLPIDDKGFLHESSHDNSSHLPTSDFESEKIDTSSTSLAILCQDHPPALSPLSASCFPSFAEELEPGKFVFTPIPNCQIQCQIHRDRLGIDKNMFPIYQLYLEGPNSRDQKCILTSRKRKKSKYCNYLITTSQQNLSRDGAGYSGKLRANFLGTDFVLYSDGVSHQCEKALPDRTNVREELCIIHYEKNIMGLRGPRKMDVLLPGLDTRRAIYNNDHTCSDYLHQFEQTNIHLENKIPEWNDESQTYILNFNGRVTQASVKNFQLIDRADNHLVLQFGRIGKDLFTLDYSYPLCAIQAFGIALSSFERKFGCE